MSNCLVSWFIIWEYGKLKWLLYSAIKLNHDNKSDQNVWVCHDHETLGTLLAIIDKYGIPISQWAWLYQVLLEVSMKTIVLWRNVRVNISNLPLQQKGPSSEYSQHDHSLDSTGTLTTFNTKFCMQVSITMKSMSNQCHGKRKFLTMQFNSKPVRRIEMYTKVTVSVTTLQVTFLILKLVALSGQL